MSVVQVTYHCPYCGAVTGIERDGYLADRCVTKEPLEGWEYAATTDVFEGGAGSASGDVDGIEFVCLGNADPGESSDGGADESEGDGCGRTFYLSFVRFEDGREVDPEVPHTDDDGPRFDFLR